MENSVYAWIFLNTYRIGFISSLPIQTVLCNRIEDYLNKKMKAKRYQNESSRKQIGTILPKCWKTDLLH